MKQLHLCSVCMNAWVCMCMWVVAQSAVCLALHQRSGGQGSQTILVRGKSESCDKGSDNWRELSGWSTGELVQESCHLDTSVHMCQGARPPMGWHTLKPVMRLMWAEMALAFSPCALTYQSSLNVKANVQLSLTPDVKLGPTSHEGFSAVTLDTSVHVLFIIRCRW